MYDFSLCFGNNDTLSINGIEHELLSGITAALAFLQTQEELREENAHQPVYMTLGKLRDSSSVSGEMEATATVFIDGVGYDPLLAEEFLSRIVKSLIETGSIEQPRPIRIANETPGTLGYYSHLELIERKKALGIPLA